MAHKWLKEMDWSKSAARLSSWGVWWKSHQSQDLPLEIPTEHTKWFLSNESDAAVAQGPREAAVLPYLESIKTQWDKGLGGLN